MFRSIDLDNSGHIGVSEIQTALAKLDVHISDREVTAILKSIDTNNDQQLDFNEFLTFFADVPTVDVRGVLNRFAEMLAVDCGADQVPAAIPPPSIPLWQYMLAGGSGGICSRTVTAPLEKIKIMAQTSESGKIRIVETFRTISTREGARGLFAGNLTNCLRVFPTSALACLVYANMIKHTPVDNQKNP